MAKLTIAQILALPGVKPSQKAEMVKNEMWRRSMDLCLVKNPTDQDFVFRFDNIPYRISARGKRRMVRYLCDNYIKRMIDHLIGEENQKRVKEENERRITHGGKAMDAQERSMFDLRIDNPELIKKYYPTVWGGVIEPFAMDDVEMNDQVEVRKVNAYEQLDTEYGEMKASDEGYEESEDEIVTNYDEPLPVYDQLEDKSRNELMDLARTKGIKTNSTDTKANLMNKLTGV
jgi:hypothetical protein